MDPRLVTSVLSVAAVLLSLAHGHPQEASAEVLTKSSPLQDLTKVSALEDAKTSPIEKTGEKRETPDLPKSEPSPSLGAKLKVRFPSEDAKPGLPLKDEGDESVRSLRQSPSMNFGHGPPTTTVCIQIRSSNHPEVVCGPQVEDKKEDHPSARYAYPEYYARATPQYPARYAQQPPPPVPIRTPPTPVMVPVYPARRREEEVLKPVEIVPQAPARVIVAPPVSFRGLVQPIEQPTRQFIQPVMYAPQYSQASQLLRLNCGVQPDAASMFNSPLSRSGSSLLMGYYPVGEQVVTLQDGPSTLLGPSDAPLRARMASDGQNYLLNQEYAYPWSSAAYFGESGFYPMDMQGRSAGSGSDTQYSNYMEYPAESAMDESARSLLQEQELQQSRLRLKMLQNQLRELHQRAAADEALKGAPATDTQDQQKKDQVRQNKRQAKPKET